MLLAAGERISCSLLGMAIERLREMWPGRTRPVDRGIPCGARACARSPRRERMCRTRLLANQGDWQARVRQRPEHADAEPVDTPVPEALRGVKKAHFAAAHDMVDTPV